MKTKVVAKLIAGRSMSTTKETFTFRFFARDYKNADNGNLSISNYKTQTITIDTTNYLPRVYNVEHDVNGRVMFF